MYHVGDVPYFPVGAICPNRSGVDMTFEREGKYRASFIVPSSKLHNNNLSIVCRACGNRSILSSTM